MLKKIVFFVVTVFLSGCHFLNPSTMFKTPPEYRYTNFSNSAPSEYKISPNDIISFSLFTNDGNKMIDVGPISNSSSGSAGTDYLVEIDGNVKLPVIGRVKVSGMTTREAEKMLVEKYTVYFVNPFITLAVLNRRVMIFPGLGGAAKVITLENENTTLLEALAQSGGIPQTGKAHKIKLIRRTGNNSEVQLIDLSKIEGLPDGNIVLQANDIIYVQPSAKISQGILAEISPILALVSTLLLSYTLILNLKK